MENLKRFINIVMSIFLSLTIIGAAVWCTVAFRQMYYNDIDSLNIVESTGMSKEEIKMNYDYLIDYNLKSKVGSFKLPTLPSSENGAIHFEEVRDIIQNVIKIFSVCAFISIIAVVISVRNKNVEILKITSLSLIFIPLVLSVPILVNFERSFVLFHEVLFNNDYWIFDPALDPVIMMLPEQFFFHAGMMILGIILFISVLMYIFYRFVKRRVINP